MHYIKYGEKEVSVIAAGCMRIADMNEAEATAYVDVALEAGINFFDHADIYGGGKSEEIFGKVLDAHPSYREQMFIQSKCGIRNGWYDSSKEHILQSVDGILSRLRTDYLDCLLIHRPDALMEPEEMQEAFAELKRQGKVRRFGVSNMNPVQMRLIESGGDEKLVADQVQMSIVHTPLIDAGVNVNMKNEPAVMRDGGILEHCRLNNMAVQIWSPLQKGFFGGIFIGDDAYKELNAVLDRLADKYGVSADAICYAWLLRIPAKMQVVVGTSKPERLRSAATAADITLEREEWYELYKAAGNQLP